MKEKYIKFTPRQLTLLLRLVSIQTQLKIDSIPVAEHVDFYMDDIPAGFEKVLMMRTIKKVHQRGGV